MENSEKSKLVNQAAGKIEEALYIFDSVEDDQTEIDRDLTNAYYRLNDLKTSIDFIADAYQSE